MKQFILLLYLALLLVLTTNLTAQNILEESDTRLVLEAQYEIQKAYTEFDLSNDERIELMKHGAKTLKLYGQSPIWPDENIPYKKAMEENFKSKMDDFKKANNLMSQLSQGNLKKQLKFITNLELDIANEQIKFLIPGSTPISLSQDLVSFLFQWNITDGTSGGQQESAKGLKSKMKEIIKEKEIEKCISEFRDYELNS